TMKVNNNYFAAYTKAAGGMPADEAGNDFARELKKMRAEGEKIRNQIESMKQDGEAAAKALEIQRKCFIIAMRIIRGDDVHPADHRLLAENEPEMYNKAILLRRQKEDPEKHERLSEDEKEKSCDLPSDSYNGSCGGRAGHRVRRTENPEKYG
ncbi:MAG: hypothetical protein FWG21_04455, partial [Oscillospiraceae bacterium]|nr:hypothetical protein [Oscillospiraceae bacterium]